VLNLGSYDARSIEKLNFFLNKVVIEHVVVIATMKTKGLELFGKINPCLEWDEEVAIGV